MPEVSIIVPVYQAEKFIGKCIESICNQTFENFELILIDDGSRDGSYTCCLKYADKDKRIRVLYQENKGVSAARNRGLQAATGEYVLFVDADDCIEIDMIEYMYKKAKETCAEVVICGYDYVYNNRNDTQMPMGKEGICDKSFIITNFWEFYRRGVIHNIGNKLYAKDLLYKNRIVFDENKTILEDVQFCLEAINKAHLIYLCQKSFYKYMMQENPNSIQKRYRKDFYLNLQRFFLYIDNLQVEKTKDFYLIYMDALLLSLRNELYKTDRKFSALISEYENICHLKYVKESEKAVELKDVGWIKYIFYINIWRDRVIVLFILIFMWDLWQKMKGLG